MALSVRIVSPERVAWEGEASSLVAPAWDGQVGVLPGHAPMIALLGAGELSVDAVGGGSETHFVAGGVLKVLEDGVTVLAEYVGEGPPETLPDSVVPPEDYTGHASPGNPLV